MTDFRDRDTALQRRITAPDQRAPALAALAEFVATCWRGGERLWKVFWLFGVAGAAAVGYVVGQVEGVVRSSPMWIGVGLIFWGLAAVASVAYQVWAYVSIWRCAFNADWKGWGYIARAFAVLGALGMIFAIVGLLQEWATLL
jgi:hypothetical protein